LYNLRNQQLQTRIKDSIQLIDYIKELSSKEIYDGNEIYLDEMFNGRISEDIFMMGHSFGGITAISTAQNDKRIVSSVYFMSNKRYHWMVN
jgi:predicted dienelactone hydrolase